MDPLSALSVAAASVQFIQFSTSLISGSIEIYQSSDGAKQSNRTVESLIDRLSNLTTTLVEAEQKSQAQSDTAIEVEYSRQLRVIVNKCRAISKELFDVLAALKGSGRHRITQSFLSSVKAIRRENKIKNLEQELRWAHNELGGCLLALMHNKQSGILSALQRLSQRLDSMAISHERRLGSLASTLGATVTERNRALSSELGALMSSIAREVELSQAQLRILESLRYTTMKMRESSISRAHRKTYRWILQPSSRSKNSNVRFIEWLQQGTGLFWIAGKPGSGKSTLMKLLHSHEKTEDALRVWARSSPLVVASHFFWYAGVDLQKSQEGLLRTLLDKILTECPHLMPLLCPKRWNDTRQQGYPWTMEELLRAFENLKSSSVTDSKFCFFIDALDEYRGNCADIAKVVAKLCESPNIKVCFSGREWPALENMFGPKRHDQSLRVQKIQMQLLTKDDIHRYVSDQLGSDLRYQRFKRSLDDYPVSTQKIDLLQEITDRAQGVFLWVTLVCDNLLRGLSNDDSLKTLQKRLHSLPTDLDDYFGQMLSRLDPVYLGYCVEMLQLVMASRRPLSVRVFDFLEADLIFALSDNPGMPPVTNDVRETRLKSIGADLMEFVAPRRLWDVLGLDVVFIHRTVHEFMSTSRMQEFLAKHTRRFFDVHTYLSQAFLALTQIIGSSSTSIQTKRAEIGNEVNAILDEMGYHMRQMERQEIVKHNILLDLIIHLDRSLDALYDKHGFTPSPLPGWGDGYESNYVAAFAAHQGLCGMVGRQLHRPGGIINDTNYMFPLIHYALHRIWFAPAEHQEKKRDMVRVLLRHGAKPDYPCPGGSPWKRFIEGCKTQNHGIVHSDMVPIMMALIDAGACPLVAKDLVSSTPIASSDWHIGAGTDSLERLKYAVVNHRISAHLPCLIRPIYYDFMSRTVLKPFVGNTLRFELFQVGLISSIVVSLLCFLTYTPLDVEE
ncbi:hypothetical protein B0T10DRAFT_577280 [Thelonectria olida]|uniref:NACHT domain-containing protein n=1 Tax=Thelonectria olida TaxID=1576542 RepID=A0A9P9ALK5_9HYPO|nr:hypothetical protein B0T10DRAFT_577280 [Thelonectria olida]